jgi:hypothetical protein
LPKSFCYGINNGYLTRRGTKMGNVIKIDGGKKVVKVSEMLYGAVITNRPIKKETKAVLGCATKEQWDTNIEVTACTQLFQEVKDPETNKVKKVPHKPRQYKIEYVGTTYKKGGIKR